MYTIQDGQKLQTNASVSNIHLHIYEYIWKHCYLVVCMVTILENEKHSRLDSNYQECGHEKWLWDVYQPEDNTVSTGMSK